MSFLKLSKESDKVLSDNGKILSTEMTLNFSPFAIYSDDDKSFTFYYGTQPKVGDYYNQKIVSNIYTNFEFDPGEYPDWSPIRTKALSVVVDKSFSVVKPTSTENWFIEFFECLEMDLKYLDTSNVTDMFGMFQECDSLTTLDVSSFDTSNVTDMRAMFFSCGSLTTIFSDDNNFVINSSTSGSNTFYGCKSLVGGNGTQYDASKQDVSMAHIDTPENPGYFTEKGD